MAREEGESFQPLQPNSQQRRSPARRRGHRTVCTPRPQSSGGSALGEPGGTGREGRGHGTEHGKSSFCFRGTAARLAQGKGTEGPPPRRLCRVAPVQPGTERGWRIKSGGAGLGCTAEPGSPRPQRDARPRAPGRARAPLRVTFLLHLEQQLGFPCPSPPPLPLLSSRFIPACSSSHSLPPSAILQACDVGSRSPLTHI